MSANEPHRKFSLNITPITQASKPAHPVAGSNAEVPKLGAVVTGFPLKDDIALQEATAKVSLKLEKLDAWLVKFGPQRTGAQKIPDEVHSQVLEYRRLAKNLQVAASVPVALALYGASQSGKSLFVGQLVRSTSSGQTALGLHQGDKTPPTLDFQRHLNPARGGEATAVVTRFTAGTRSGVSQELGDTPVRARLFSRCDIIKALSRGFFSECIFDQSRRWTSNSLEMLLAGQARGDGVDLEWRADLVEAYRYIRDGLKQHTFDEDADTFGRILMRYPLTTSGYFKVASAIFYDNWEEMEDLFKSLLDMRQKDLKGHEYLYLGWEPVNFILDTTITENIPQGERTEPFGSKSLSWGDYRLDVTGGNAVLIQNKRSGKSVELALLQGLISEIQIPIVPERLEPKCQELFLKADVLDVPGAVSAAGRASMSKKDVARQVEKGEHPQLRILKRGKVGLLFEKYADEKQTNLLIYLQGIGNLDAKSELAPQIEQWGKASFNHDWPTGLTQDNHRIFVGITKVDSLLKLSESKTSFDKHIGELVTTFSRWMTNYGGEGRRFTGIHLIRYPGIIDGLEHGNLRRRQDWRQAYLQSEKVQQYIEDAEAKWDAAFGEDGGITALLERVLSRINNEQRRAELTEQASEISATISALFRQFWIDPSVEAEANRRRDNAKQVIEWLDHDKYGRRAAFLLEYLHCSEDHIPASLDAEKPPAGIPVPTSVDYKRVARNVLLKWSLQSVPLDAERTLSAHDHISSNILVSFRSYVREYLEKTCVDQIAELLKPICANGFQGDSRKVMLRYAAMVIDDYIITPGPRDIEQHQYRYIEVPFKGLVERYKRLLEHRLVQGCAGGGISMPAGNTELGDMISAGLV